MPLETGTTISELSAIWPLGSDFGFEGDDHLRLIKSVLKSQFPGSGGDGFSTPITATEVEINYLDGVTSKIQEQLDAITGDDTLTAPQGTKMVFVQASPPVGWTQNTSQNDSMLRVVSGTGGGVGGSQSPISFSHSHTTGSHALTIDEMPAHTHTITNAAVFNKVDIDGGGGREQYNRGTQTTNSTGGGQSHSHGNTGDASFSPRYQSCITAVKD